MMHLGFVSAIVPEFSFEELIHFTQAQGFTTVEAACWPAGKAERRYAGVSHFDVENLDQAQADDMRDFMSECGVHLSALAYYPNPLDENLQTRDAAVAHLHKLIDKAPLLRIPYITTFIGKMQHADAEENWKAFMSVWPELIRHAEDKGVALCIENCPMYFTKDEWPGGKNLASSPQFWEQMFDAIPSDSFALNYDPSHFVIQQMDYIQPIYQFAEKIKHFHIKDVHFFREKFNQVGFMAPPLAYIAPKLPGLGDVNWGAVVSALNDIGYRGDICIEVEDRAYENTLEDRLDAIRLSKRYMEQFVI